ncbi:head GIN domain-containing protein [Roseivirga sp. 4D4]|uniref:head GIN domain-containing protein n=1 Tax=Roseivirga sp. 4D4 TaxID=1889784 RepID=UPI00147ADFF1|nr:head GIN domain-containing protein [Roseivirga sp. 4D4]
MKNTIKTQITIILLFITSIAFAQETDTRSLDSFTELKVSEGIQVIAKKGNENSVDIEVSRMDIDRVRTEVRGDRLSIFVSRNSWSRRNRNGRIRVTLTYTEEIEEIVANTSAEISFEDMIETRRLSVTTSTSGVVDAKIKVTSLDLSATTSGRIDMTGDADEVEATASTGGTIYAYDVEAIEVYAKANTGADVRVNAQERLRASANTGGTVSYRGRPKADVRSNTGGSIRRAR